MGIRNHYNRRDIFDLTLHIQVLDFGGVALDKFAAGWNLIAHQHAEGLVGDGGILNTYAFLPLSRRNDCLVPLSPSTAGVVRCRDVLRQSAAAYNGKRM